MRTGAFSKTSNGFPHRIPPPADDSDSSVDGDYDMLNDANHEKDVFRTKVTLFKISFLKYLFLNYLFRLGNV